MNRNWLKVLTSEVMMVVSTLAVFFICHAFGVEEKEAVVAAAITIAFVMTVAAFAAFAYAITVITAAAFAVVAAVAAFVVTFAATAVFAIAVVAFAVIAFTVAFFVVVKEHKLPVFWLVASYIGEAAVIFLPIYLSIN